MASGQVLRICEVIDTRDPEGMDRIKVRLLPEDNHISNVRDIPYAFPLLPKNFFVKPKNGETVVVITIKPDDGNSQRFYMGPIIPQLNKMSGNSHKMEGTEIFDGSLITPGKSPYTDPSAEGIFPEDDDISIIGKKNTDIQLKDNDLRIRCGMGVRSGSSESGLEFNRKNPAYIKMACRDSDGEASSTVNIVADNVNVIGNRSRDHYNTVDKKDLITDEELDRFLKEAHQLPYGDKLVDFLKRLRDAFITHTHPYPMLPPSLDIKMKEVAAYDLDSILSDSVRIN